MKVRKVGIPRLNNDNLREVVARLLESVDELQGAVGSPEQRAVRLGELLRARIARVDPRGDLLLEEDTSGDGGTGTGGDVEITGQPGRIVVQQGGQAFVLDLATVTPSLAGALLALQIDTFGRVVGTKPVVPGANVTIDNSGAQTVISATAGAASSYTHTQASPSTSWTINHNLGFNPTVSIRTVGGAEIEAEVTHTSVNQTVVSLTAALAGTARLN